MPIPNFTRWNIYEKGSIFPDEFFREYVSTNLDIDHDGVLSDEEIAAITGIDVTGLGITSLKGIEYFTALQELICSGSQLTELDVSSNTTLTGLDCSNNQLTSLTLGDNTVLEYLDCTNNSRL